MQHKYPNFIVIGPTKSGSTSLFRYLEKHPEIYMSPIKNPKYFYADWNRYENFPGGAYTIDDYNNSVSYRNRRVTILEDYLELFDNVSDEAVVGEISPGCITYPDSYSLIKNFNPDMKIIAVLRNPVERAYSHYMFWQQAGRETETDLISAMEKEDIDSPVDVDELKKAQLGGVIMPDYIRTGLYYKNLKPYFDTFDKDKIHIIMFDEYKKDAENVLKKLYEFLGVDASFKVDLTKKYNVTGRAKSNLLNLVLNGLGQHNWIKKWIPQNKYEYLQDKVHCLRSKNIEKTRLMTQSERIFLSKFFTDDISDLEKLLDKDLSHWR